MKHVKKLTKDAPAVAAFWQWPAQLKNPAPYNYTLVQAGQAGFPGPCNPAALGGFKG